MQQYANDLIARGLAAIPCIMPAKRPALPTWTKYQKELPKQNEHKYREGMGIGLVTGVISGLIVIDIDLKYDTTGTLWQRFKDAITSWPEIEKKAYIQKTINNGYHVFLKTKYVSANRKIAARLATPEELLKSPHEKNKCVIETRENGGFIVIAPTKGYEKISGSFADLKEITHDEYKEVMTACFSFNEIHETVLEKKVDGIKPWDDFNTRVSGIDILERNGWQYFRTIDGNDHYTRPGKDKATGGTWKKELNLFYCFTSSSSLTPGKAYTPASLFTFLECNGDFSAAAKKMVADGYGSHIIKTTAKKANDSSTLQTFYTETKTGIKLHVVHLLEIISKHGGFYIYYPTENKSIYRIIKITDGFVCEATSEMIKKYVIDFVNSTEADPDSIIEAIHANNDKIFSKNSLEFLPSIDLNLLTHSQQTAYYPFLNGVVCVEPEKEIKLIPYSTLKMHVWQDHVIQHDFIYCKDYESSEFLKFVALICNADQNRFALASSIIGYLLHGFKDPAKPYAIILAEEVENEDSGGGTGKGIFFRAISKIIKTLVVDGKSFKHDKSFLFQRVDLSTQLIVVDDCRKNLDFQGFYSHISEGLTVEKKNKDEIHISYSKSPKFLFSTNYTINIDGSHGKRRVRMIEFSNFFSSTNTPIDYFGHLLFDGWDKKEWDLFFSAAMHCVYDYLVSGIPVGMDSDTIKRKEIAQRFTKEFLDFFDQIQRPCSVLIADQYVHFLADSQIEKKDFSFRRFKMAIEFTAKSFSVPYSIKRRSAMGGKHEINFE